MAMPETGQRPEAYVTYHFRVEIGKKEVAAFKEFSGPSLEMEVFEYQEGGANGYVHKLPGRWKVGNITLKRGISRSDELWKWCQDALKAAASGTWNLKPRDVTVKLCDATGKDVVAWTFSQAYPVKWSAPTFKADENAIAVEELELAHEGLQP
jgi:phage tail-like protein